MKCDFFTGLWVSLPLAQVLALLLGFGAFFQFLLLSCTSPFCSNFCPPFSPRACEKTPKHDGHPCALAGGFTCSCWTLSDAIDFGEEEEEEEEEDEDKI